MFVKSVHKILRPVKKLRNLKTTKHLTCTKHVKLTILVAVKTAVSDTGLIALY